MHWHKLSLMIKLYAVFIAWAKAKTTLEVMQEKTFSAEFSTVKSVL